MAGQHGGSMMGMQQLPSKGQQYSQPSLQQQQHALYQAQQPGMCTVGIGYNLLVVRYMCVALHLISLQPS